MKAKLISEGFAKVHGLTAGKYYDFTLTETGNLYVGIFLYVWIEKAPDYFELEPSKFSNDDLIKAMVIVCQNDERCRQHPFLARIKAEQYLTEFLRGNRCSNKLRTILDIFKQF
jgi:hypothetical protein